ncbi:MAG: hypothetical protein M3P27_02915 [Acidobacteriota bacterium]|nr:hypothetical protein [Acidobacteriota bacterium]
MRLKFEVDASGIPSRVETVRLKVLRAIKLGMRESMSVVAAATAGKVHSRTGQLAAAIIKSVRVRQTDIETVGSISGDVGRKHVGLWLEKGTRAHLIGRRTSGFSSTLITQLFNGNQRPVRLHPGQPPRPFMNPTLQALKGEIQSRIAARIDEALANEH